MPNSPTLVLSRVKNETRTSTKSVGGTLQWMAPELFTLRPKHNKKSDIYSLGITFWEIVARQIPYQGARTRCSANSS